MESSDPLMIAVQDVTSVAAELREVKKRADEYGQSTSRLQEVTAALGQIAEAISGIQFKFHNLLSRADTVTRQIDEVRLVSETTAKSVPEIVARIEATDISKSVGQFSRSLDSVSDRITTQLSAIERLHELLSKERDEQKQMFEEIAARSERVAGTVENLTADVASLKSTSDAQVNQSKQALSQLQNMHASLRGYAGSLDATRAASDRAANASGIFGLKVAPAVAELSKKIDAMQTALEAQNNLIAALKQKKGFLF